MKSITQKEKRLADMAIRFIDKSNHPKYKLVSILYKKGVLSIGVNRISAKPFYIEDGLGEITRHAEVDCLHMVDRSTSQNAILITIGQTRAGNLISTKPCPSCLSHLTKMGIKCIIYQNVDGSLVKERI